MINHILSGESAREMAIELLTDKAIAEAWDLTSGGFAGCVRVKSHPEVNDLATRQAFDALLDERAAKFNVVRRNDSGQYAGVDGTPILLST